jgi:hypothetical protein
MCLDARKRQSRVQKEPFMPRQLDFRVHAIDTDVLVFNDSGVGWISLVIEQPAGVDIEAMLTTAQAAELVADLQRELHRS